MSVAHLTGATASSRRRLRVVIVAESFLPSVNGVTNSVLRVLEHLRRVGFEAIVVAPGPGEDDADGTPVVRVRSFDLPRYDDVRVALPRLRLMSILRDFRPDVVHLAAPTLLGAAAVHAARRAGIPTVAVFQTDLAGFARRHGLGRMGDQIWRYLGWVHGQADRTLAPSTTAVWALTTRGVPNVELWARGVDLQRFHPRHRSDDVHRFLAPKGEVLVGYIGRLAKEKQVERLAPLLDLGGIRVVVVGDGPERARLESKLPGARFVGFQTGDDLSRLHATLDVFVHTGVDETFCQALQESMASGVPSVAPCAGGPLDLVRHRESGYLWTPDAPETMVGAVGDLAGDAEVRRRLGCAARRDAERRPWAQIMDELVDHYHDVVHDPVRRSASMGVA